jgi:protein subunit release factor A
VLRAERGRKTVDTIIIEIRAAEGGEDAKLLVAQQYRVYERFMELEGL